MNILHITPHLGGGVGTVITDWVCRGDQHNHMVVSLDTINDKSKKKLASAHVAAVSDLESARLGSSRPWDFGLGPKVSASDVVLVHYWDHPMLYDLLAGGFSPCRMLFWCHKNFPVPEKHRKIPDHFVSTSPIQGYPWIWSTGNMERFMAIEPKPHEGFVVGTVASPKLHPSFPDMCIKIHKAIPDVRFMILGENFAINDPMFTTIGKVDDVAPYLAEMDVFAYPLRPDHYGTCEIALGEAMAAGVPPVVMQNPAERIILGSCPRSQPFVSRNEKEFIDNVVWLYENRLTWRSPEHPVFVRKALGNYLKEKAMKFYDIDKMIHCWDNIFRMTTTWLAKTHKEGVRL